MYTYSLILVSAVKKSLNIIDSFMLFNEIKRFLSEIEFDIFTLKQWKYDFQIFTD